MSDEERVCEILAHCRESVERGDAIDTDAIVRQNPELAETLRLRLGALAALDRAYMAQPAADLQPPCGEDLVGRLLGPYRILQPIGAGGMGSVWRAEVEGTAAGLEPGRTVALKVLHPHLFATPGFFERFLREVEVGKAVAHRNVVRTLDADQGWIDARSRHFLVMEYVEGQTLRGLLREMHKVPEELCRHIGREVAKGLAAIHAAGIVHRDVKPENVLITGEHVVKLTDLGVARLAQEVVRLSQTGAFVGSIQYAAPEQFARSGADIDARADLHALGLVLYELACGVNPYFGDDLPQIVTNVLNAEPRRLGVLDPQISPFFEELVHHLLEKDREKRFASARVLVDVLEAGEAHPWWREHAKALRLATRRPLRRVRIPRETAVYGREADLAKLRRLYERARGSAGQVVLIEGEAGIGKSRLVDELVGRLQQDEQDLSFLHGSYAPGGAATASGAFSTAYREQLGDAGAGEHLKRTPSLVPAFDALLRGDAKPAGTEALTKESLQTCFVHATQALASERTTVVLIDDLHFAPEEGLALFTSLALAVSGHRVLLVGTSRPGLPEVWKAGVTRLDHVHSMTLERLGAKELVHLLEDAFRSPALASTLMAQIALKSDGNPFFVFEIIRGLREGQFIVQGDDGTWVTTGAIGEIRIPSSILDLVNARVAGLSQEERDVVDVACCWGFEFDPLLVGDAVGIGRIPLLKLLSRIERSHRIVRSTGSKFVFDHHQVQEALYQGLPELLRQEYHGALATALETRETAAGRDPAALPGAVCVDLCEHFLRGAQGRRALRYLGAALTRLETGYLNAAAVALAERILAVPGLVAGAERAQLLLRLADRLDFLGRRDRQITVCREVEDLARAMGDETLCGRATWSLGVAYSQLSEFPSAKEALCRARESGRRSGDKHLEAAASGSLGNVSWSLGALGEAREHHERHLALAREIGDRHREATALGSLGLLYFSLGRVEDARAHHERSRALAREIGDRRGEAIATGNLGGVYLALGRLAEARTCCERQLALAQEIGYRKGEAAARGGLGNILDALGLLAEAREHYERHLVLAREIGDRVFEAMAAGNLGLVAADLGRLAEARSLSERKLAIAREIGSGRQEGHALNTLADLAVDEGDASAAERGYMEALAVHRSSGSRDGEATSLRTWGALLVQLGRPEEARVALGEAIAIARDLSLDGIELLATASLARLPGGDAGPALATLAAREGRVPMRVAMCARFELWKATQDRAHLAEAKRRLDLLVEHAPSDCRESMLASVRLHREIVVAVRALGL